MSKPVGKKPAVRYKRIVLKLSGEVLRGQGTDPIDATVLERMCHQVKEIHDLGVQICVVIGGGTIFRGLQGEQRGVDRTTGDYMGMLATVINASYALAGSIGRLTAQDLGLPVEQYDMTAYYNAVRNRWVGLGDYSMPAAARR